MDRSEILSASRIRIRHNCLVMDLDMTRSARMLLPMIRSAMGHLPAVVDRPPTVAVDLTPWPLPASNGFDAAAVCRLLQALCEYETDWRWILLTAPGNHELFGHLDGLQMRRHCVTPVRPPVPLPTSMRPEAVGRRLRLKRAAYRLLGLPRPPVAMMQETLLRQLHADLMLCPFGGSHAYDGTVPMVALWNDLTLLHYPQFLSPRQRAASETLFKQAVYQADKVICFSGHARAEILNITQVEERRVASLRPQPMARLPHLGRAEVAAELNQLGLGHGKYLFNPGEFTEDGNHKLLLVALGMIRNQHPRTDLKIVFSGSATAARQEMQDAAASMGLADHAVFADAEMPRKQAALLQGCLAVMMPFLEATAAPLLFQAIEFSKPILCSDLADLPEPVRAAALVFDPTKVAQIVSVLERLTGTGELAGELAERSHRQAAALGGPRHLACDMVDVLEDVLHSSHRSRNAIKTVYPDAWTSERILVTCAAASEPRTLHLTLETPPWFPWGFQRVHLLENRHTTGKLYKLKRGRTLTIKRPLPREGGCLEFLLDPPLIPAALGLGDDDRLLGCICRECTITGSSSTAALHPAGDAKQ